MDNSADILEQLEGDMAYNILKCLDDPVDLIRATGVSRFWRHFAIANRLSKQLCLKKFPQLSFVECIAEPNCGLPDVGSSGAVEWEHQKKEHNVYASLLQALNTSILSPRDSIVKAISASSTDNYPDESIINTLNPRDRYINRGSYWSSTGQSDPAVPETLIYNLKANLCVITGILIQPFEAFFQPGSPIYSAQYMRFRMGHPKSPNELDDLQKLPLQQPADDKFVWTYTSQDFAMVQENRLQEFKLPEPVLCIGGYLQVEMFGRVQRQEMDGLFYICVARVQVMGRALSPAFNIDVLPSGKFQLKYNPEALHQTLQMASNNGEGSGNLRVLSPEEVLWGRVGLLEYLIGGNQAAHLDWVSDEEELDELPVL